MRIILLLTISFLISCKVNKPDGKSPKIMVLTMDLSSVNLSKTQRMVPATFETVTEEITFIDKVVKDGYYLEQAHSRVIKDKYKSLKPIINQGVITYKMDTLIRYNGSEDIHVEARIKNYTTYQYCATCNNTNGISYKDVHKSMVKISAEEGMPYSKMLSRQKLHENAKVVSVYVDDTKFITVKGTKAELQQLLAHPKLAGITHNIKREGRR